MKPRNRTDNKRIYYQVKPSQAGAMKYTKEKKLRRRKNTKS